MGTYTRLLEYVLYRGKDMFAIFRFGGDLSMVEKMEAAIEQYRTLVGREPDIVTVAKSKSAEALHAMIGLGFDAYLTTNDGVEMNEIWLSRVEEKNGFRE